MVGLPSIQTPVEILMWFTAANQMAQQMAQANPGAAGANLFGPGQDIHKLFLSEAENLEVLEHWSVMEGI